MTQFSGLLWRGFHRSPWGPKTACISPHTAAEPLVANLCGKVLIHLYWFFTSESVVTSRLVISAVFLWNVCFMTRGACDQTGPGSQQQWVFGVFIVLWNQLDITLQVWMWRHLNFFHLKWVAHDFLQSVHSFILPHCGCVCVSHLSFEITAAISTAALSKNIIIMNPSGVDSHLHKADCSFFFLSFFLQVSLPDVILPMCYKHAR